MFRLNHIGLALSLTFTLAAAAAPVRADDWEEEGPGSQGASAVRGNGEVSVDIEGATPGLSQEVFRSTLAPYGEWRVSPRYGEVWRPRVAVGWRPYYDGSWLWTDEGWYWDSSEPFAWAVYHYGRWVYDPAWGWVWVPGYQWAPAWVTWRYGGDVVGWAPLGPGVSVFVTSYPFIDFWWTFVPCYQFVGVPVYTVAYPPRDTHRWFGSTAPAPPRTTVAARGGSLPAPAWGGPSRRFIEERTGRPVAVERRPAWRPEARGFERGPGVQRERVPSREQRQESWRGGGRERAPAWGPPPAREERRGSGRPEAVPVPRGEGSRPQMEPAPRGEGPRPQPEPRPRGEPRRSWGR
jgi:hypothetical protein